MHLTGKASGNGGVAERLKAPKVGLRFLLISLGVQIAVWFFLATHLPMTQLPYTSPSFSYDAQNERLCMVLIVTGSHGGQAVGDTYCIDAESGKLSQLSTAQRMEELEQADPEGGRRKLTQSPDGSFKLKTFDTDRQRVLAERELDLPGYTPTLVNDRYVVTQDETHLHVWDAQNPDKPVKSLPTATKFPFVPRALRGKNGFYYNTSVAAARQPNPARTTPPELPIRRIHLFGVTQEGAPLLIASWTVLSNSKHSFSSIATTCENELATITANADAIEFHSIADGSLVRQQPLPAGFDPFDDIWYLGDGRLYVRGGTDRQFDLKANAWLPSPGEGYQLRRQSGVAGLWIYWRPDSGGEWNIFDHRRGKSLFRFPARTGFPVLMDDEKLAICSAAYGFRVELIDLPTGRRLQRWTPWWWVPPLLVMAMLAYAIWSSAWVAWAAARHQAAWIDVAIIAGTLIAVAAYRLFVTGGPPRSYSYGYSVPEQLVRGILCAGLVMATCGLFAGRARLIGRLLTFAFLVAAAGALLRLLLVYISSPKSWVVEQNIELIYSDAWTALAGMIPILCVALVSCWVSLAIGFRLRIRSDPARASLEDIQQRPAPATKSATWGIVDLLLLTAACAALVAVLGPLAATAIPELDLIAGNGEIDIFLMPLLKSAVVTTALMFGCLAKSRWIFLLAGLAAAALLVALSVEPVVQFATNAIPYGYSLSGQHQRFMLTCPAAAFLMCLPYRLRGWRYSWR